MIGEPLHKMVYLFGYTDGRIKIGSSYNVARRYREHVRAVGREHIAWFHIFPLCYSADRFGFSVESVARDMLKRRAERIGATEVFRGVSRADAVGMVRDLILKMRAEADGRQRAAEMYRQELADGEAFRMRRPVSWLPRHAAQPEAAEAVKG